MSGFETTDFREQRVEEMMSFVLYPDADTSITEPDGAPYCRTIREAVDFDFDETDIPEVLAGATPVAKNLELVIKERRITDLVSYANRGVTAGPSSTAARAIRGDTVAGVPFKEEQHVKAFGYSWYSILSFTMDNGGLKYLLPWGQSWYKGGAPFPRAYTLGQPDESLVENIIYELNAT